MMVKNVNGSSKWSAPSGYSSWLDYWEQNAHQKAYYCGASGCYGTDLVGAHVKKAYGTDERCYITPLCKKCNQKDGAFEVSSKLVPVPSNL